MTEIITTKEGTRFIGFPNDHLFSEIKSGNSFTDGFLKGVIEKYVKPDSVCVDVGANLGYVSLYLAQRCKRVLAFEPQPVVFLQLCANLFLNQQFNVTPYQMGLYSSTTFLDFAEYQSGWVGTHDFTDYSKIVSIGSISFEPKKDGDVIGRRLDDVIKTKVDFIKIDAQGADIDVIFGAEELMRAHHPVIVFEYEHDLSMKNYGRTLGEINPFLDRLGYKMEEIASGNYLLT